MPKAVPRNSRAIVVQLVTNIETGNEKGYGHFSCRIFSAYGPEFPLISSSNDGIMLRNIFRLPLGRLFYCICPMSLLGFLVAGIACTIACVGALFCCRIFSVRRHLCMWRSLCCSNRNFATPHDLHMRPSWPFELLRLFRFTLVPSSIAFSTPTFYCAAIIFSINQNPMTRRKILQHR